MAHSLVIRIMTIDGILVSEATDFTEDTQFDRFDELAENAQAGEVVQLIELTDDRILAEQIIQ